MSVGFVSERLRCVKLRRGDRCLVNVKKEKKKSQRSGTKYDKKEK